MCGILGILSVHGARPSVGPEAIARMRDTMASRGPDAHGLWIHQWAALAHRRLAVIDPTEAAAQPMLSADGRHALVYNGELYNDADLRRELTAAGVLFRTSSDTETVLRALMHWGPAALPRLRGMFALAWVNLDTRRVLLARDPLGIKPLYYAAIADGRELIFASDLRAILAHPSLTPQPDPVTASAYLTTIRTVMGERTLFAGVRTLRPGQAIEIDAAGESLRLLASDHPPARAQAQDEHDPQIAAERIRRAITDSVRRHLRSDVPICALLSGGLDSSIIALIAARELGSLHTYCAGARLESSQGEDFAFAEAMSAHIASRHTEVPVTRELFAKRWPEMVAELGLPLSTPNEVAIAAVASRLRADGMVVALSGEGADELFAGYESPMAQAAEYEGKPAHARQHPGEFQLLSTAWIHPDAKPALLNQSPLRVAEGDAALLAHYREEFELLSAQTREPLQAHLAFQRRINLAGLLQRLDTATMLASVEGRTPFADRVVAGFAESLPMSLKYRPASTSAPADTKIILRRAFADDLPPEILGRPKASFPLPFQQWVGDNASVLRTSAFAREFFSAPAIESVAAQPERLWHLAWPMINLALWGRRWWG